jgi:hypothetical protein
LKDNLLAHQSEIGLLKKDSTIREVPGMQSSQGKWKAGRARHAFIEVALAERDPARSQRAVWYFGRVEADVDRLSWAGSHICIPRARGSSPWSPRVARAALLSAFRRSCVQRDRFAAELRFLLSAYDRYYRTIRSGPRRRTLMFELMCSVVPSQLRDRAATLLICVGCSVVLKQRKTSIGSRVHAH